MNKIINYIKEKQKEYHEGSPAYNVLRALEVELPSLFEPSEQKPPEVSVEQTATAEELRKAFEAMEAKAILLKIVPKNCYWEDMENLTNTPIEYVLKAMQEYATLQRNEAIQECIPLIEKCEKTFGIINDILKSLQEAQPADLYLLVREVDIDLPLIQAKIKDELIRLKR